MRLPPRGLRASSFPLPFRSKGHAHPERFEEDCEKYNEAALYGWTLIRVTPDMIRDGRAIDWLDRALRI